MAGSAGAIVVGALTLFVGYWLNLPARKRVIVLLVAALLLTMIASSALTLEPGSSHVWDPYGWDRL